VVRAAFQQGGIDDVHEEESIQDFRGKCKANIVTWFSQWMQSLHAGVIYYFPQLVSKHSTTHVVKMIDKIVIPPKKVLVSGTFYKDSSSTFKLELGMLHGNLFMFLESQPEHANRVIMGHNINAELENIYNEQSNHPVGSNATVLDNEGVFHLSILFTDNWNAVSGAILGFSDVPDSNSVNHAIPTTISTPSLPEIQCASNAL
jgi:hypothetical protein